MNYVLLGGGGHAASVLDALGSTNVVGVACAGDPIGLAHTDVVHLGTDDWLLEQDPADYVLLNGIGLVPGAPGRIDVWDRFTAKGFRFATVVHDTAYLSPTAVVGDGAQILGGAQVNAAARIGVNALVNTGAIVEHHVTIGDHCHLATGVMTTGGVTIGARTFVGAGAVIIPGITIGEDVVIGAGAVVVADVADRTRVLGVPATAS